MFYQDSDKECSDFEETVSFAAERLHKELDRAIESQFEGFFIEDHEDIFNWKLSVKGPAGSPYAGFWISMVLMFPFGYPETRPMIKIDHDIYHPNQNPINYYFWVKKIHSDSWKPKFEALDFIRGVIKGLRKPWSSVIANSDAYKRMKNKEEYAKIVEERLTLHRARRDDVEEKYLMREF